MSLTLRSQISWLAVASVLAAGAVPFAPGRTYAASVQTYVNEAMPASSDSESSWSSAPVKPGDITMRDVLRNYSKKKLRSDVVEQRDTLTSGAVAPLLAPSVRPSTSGTMMMQGMRSVLRSTDTPVPATVAHPVISQSLPQGAGLQRELAGLVGATPGPSVPVAPIATSDKTVVAEPSAALLAIDGVQYQPGQAPRALGAVRDGSVAATSGVAVPYSQPKSHEAGLSSSDSQCSGRATTWVKSCSEAGYPESFVGEIHGETRTGCGGDGLRDVWVSNSCSPPGDKVDRAVAVVSGKTAAQATKESSAEAVPSVARAPIALASVPSNDERSENGVAEREVAVPVPVVAATTATASGAVAVRCGPANGLGTSRKPTTALCDAGQVTQIVGDGPWRWSCKGANGGMTVSCAAPYVQDNKREAEKEAEVSSVGSSDSEAGALSQHFDAQPERGKYVDGRCGAAAETGVDRAPSSNLCAQGVASRVSGEGPWNWACSGANGGTAVACLAPKKADGFCGSSHGKSFQTMPTTGLCSSGYASAVTGDGPWNWTCSGLYGGEAETCSASRLVNAVCGPATLAGQRKAPKTQLCSVGKPSAVAGNGPWSWSCSGSHGGSQVACSSPVIVDGACGSSNGVALPSAPSENLCAKGKPSLVSGDGPWAWGCLGADGGESETCTAPRKKETAIPAASSQSVAYSSSQSSPMSSLSSQNRNGGVVAVPKSYKGPGLCGSAAELAALVAPDRDLCAHGSAAGAVSGDGPWVWACKDSSGVTETCSTLSLGSSSAFVAESSAPASSAPLSSSVSAVTSLADSGHPSDVPNRKPPVPGSLEATGTLSAANDGASASVPSAPVSSDQPVALVKRSSAAHKAASQASVLPPPPAPPPQPKAVCGSAAGQGFSQAPTSGLCQGDSVAGLVFGDGPWTWDCLNGGSKTACTALKIVSGSCGASNGAMLDHAPQSDLCSAGAATAVYGSGPWLWTCVGAGGGGSSSCSTASMQQVRVDGVCGSSIQEMLQEAPRINLCDSGVASPVYGSGPWTWTCSGMNGGIASPCSASKASDALPIAPLAPAAPVDGYCGLANGMAVSEQPEEGLCSSGQQTHIVGEGPWNWNCMGLNGGMTVSCTAPLLPPPPLDGACGSASGTPALVAPQSGLCSSGISSAVSGSGPWTWSCSGINGGGAVGCVAPFAGRSAGLSSSAMPSLVSPGDAIPEAQAAGGSVSRGKSGQSTASASSSSRTSARDRLTTPNLQADALPGHKSAPIPLKPQSSAGIPPALSPREREGVSAPVAPPTRSADAKALVAPSLRGNERKSSSGSSERDMALVPGNHFVLNDDVSVVSFPGSDSNLGGDAVSVLDKLASVLVANKGVRVTLTAYAGNKDITPRDARRLSLSRGLAVRDYLVSKGIAAARMDVRALGSNVPSGDPDRVDVRAN